jgi:hypothetical protein
LFVSRCLPNNESVRHSIIKIGQKQTSPIQLQSLLVFLHSGEMLLRQAVVTRDPTKMENLSTALSDDWLLQVSCKEKITDNQVSPFFCWNRPIVCFRFAANTPEHAGEKM